MAKSQGQPPPPPTTRRGRRVTARVLLVVALVVVASEVLPSAGAYLPALNKRTALSRALLVGGRRSNRRPGFALGAAAGNKKKGGGGGGSIVEVKPEPEPEGGIDLPLTKGAADFRMKEMRELDPAEVEAKYSQSGGGSSDSGGGEDKPNPTHEFWMAGTIDTVGVERNKKSLLQEMKGKAAFPGFRKGQVPPYAMNQVVLFAIQDALINTVKVVIGEFGLNNGGEVTIHEDVEAISRAYKAGTNITFTATVQAAYANANGAAPKEAPEAAGDAPAAAEVLSTTEAEAAVESSE